ncbi:hypothetical protein CM1200mP19_1250 [bacterium]|nr:MAG: hypothetical protein CM1200mP19_1250 [bacterium]
MFMDSQRVDGWVGENPFQSEQLSRLPRRIAKKTQFEVSCSPCFKEY